MLRYYYNFVKSADFFLHKTNVYFKKVILKKHMSKFYKKEMIIVLEITSRESFDIVKVILTLAKYNLKVKIDQTKITFLEESIPNNVLQEFLELVPKPIVRNYPATETITETVTEKNISQECSKKTTSQKKFELKYKNAKASEVFFADFGEPYEHEIGFYRPVIVLWDFTDRVLVLPCTTNENKMEGKFDVSFETKNFNIRHIMLNKTDGMALINQLRVIDKSRLIHKIGILRNDTMEEIILNIKNYFYFHTTNFSYNQKKMLSLVDNDKLLSIIKTSIPNQAKIEKIIQLFGFDLNSKGVSYLTQAIDISININEFDIFSLCEKISNSKQDVSQQEVQRLIVARFKEKFSKEIKTAEFIRLVRTLLKEVPNNA